MPADDLYRKIGERLAWARTSRAWTQQEVALMAGIRQATICRIEKGQAEPSLATLVKIADALFLDPVWLVFGLSRDNADVKALDCS